MNGRASLGGEYTYRPGWPVEASFNHQNGTDYGMISLRQRGLMGGLKATWTISDKCRGFTHYSPRPLVPVFPPSKG